MFLNCPKLIYACQSSGGRSFQILRPTTEKSLMQKLPLPLPLPPLSLITWQLEADMAESNSHSMRLFCSGVPVSTMRRRVCTLLTHLDSADVSFFNTWPSSHTIISAPMHTHTHDIHILVHACCRCCSFQPSHSFTFNNVEWTLSTMWFTVTNSWVDKTSSV